MVEGKGEQIMERRITCSSEIWAKARTREGNANFFFIPLKGLLNSAVPFDGP